MDYSRLSLGRFDKGRLKQNGIFQTTFYSDS